MGRTALGLRVELFFFLAYFFFMQESKKKIYSYVFSMLGKTLEFLKVFDTRLRKSTILDVFVDQQTYLLYLPLQNLTEMFLNFCEESSEVGATHEFLPLLAFHKMCDTLFLAKKKEDFFTSKRTVDGSSFESLTFNDKVLHTFFDTVAKSFTFKNFNPSSMDKKEALQVFSKNKPIFASLLWKMKQKIKAEEELHVYEFTSIEDMKKKQTRKGDCFLEKLRKKNFWQNIFKAGNVHISKTLILSEYGFPNEVLCSVLLFFDNEDEIRLDDIPVSFVHGG